MPREKKVWRVTLPEGWPVNWACYNPETFAPNSSTRSGPWTRMVRLTTIAPDSRELEMLLTPNEALTYADRIRAQAKRLIAMNEEHGNGWAPDAEEG
jgi:hypothetical protein